MSTLGMDSNTAQAQEIITKYKSMSTECSALAQKISQLTNDKEEHRLVVETLSKLEPERKAYRLVGGVLVERTVGEALPSVSQNFEGVSDFLPLLLFCYFVQDPIVLDEQIQFSKKI